MKYNPQIMERVRKRLDDRGVRYVRPGDRAYFWGRFVYIAAWGYTILFLALYLISQAMQITRLGRLEETPQARIASIRSSMIVVGIGCALFVAGLTLALLRHGLAQLILTAGSGVLLTIQFVRIYNASNNGMQPSFYYRHFVPMLLLTLVSLWLFLTLHKARRIESRAYQNMVEALYRQYGGGMERMSGDDWAAFLQSYREPEGRPAGRGKKRETRQESESDRPTEPPDSEESRGSKE